MGQGRDHQPPQENCRGEVLSWGQRGLQRPLEASTPCENERTRAEPRAGPGSKAGIRQQLPRVKPLTLCPPSFLLLQLQTRQ